MGLFSSNGSWGDKGKSHGMPKGTVDRGKGSQKGTRARDHQRGLFNFSEKSTHSRSWLFGAPKKEWK